MSARPREGAFADWTPLAVPAGRAAELSRLWRTDGSERFAGRRRMLRGYLAGSAAMTVIALYQTGISPRMPELPLPGFDAPGVDASPQAYQLLGMPDAVLALLSNAATMTLIAVGGPDRPRWLRRVTAAKAGVDAAYALKLATDQVVKHRALCSWCLVTTAGILSALPEALREAR